MERGLVLQPFCLMHLYPHKEEPALVSFSQWEGGMNSEFFSDILIINVIHLWHTQCVSTQPPWIASSDSSLLLEIFFYLSRPSPWSNTRKSTQWEFFSFLSSALQSQDVPQTYHRLPLCMASCAHTCLFYWNINSFWTGPGPRWPLRKCILEANMPCEI